MAFTVSTEELISFHSIDRRVYSRLLLQLRCDPFITMRVMALWLWLEESGFPSIILNLSSLPDNIVNALFREALTILNLMQSETPPSSSTPNTIPRTYHFTAQRITLKFLHENRLHALHGIFKTVSEVFIRAFDDIIPKGMDHGNMGRELNLAAKQVQCKERGANNQKLNTTALPYVPPALRSLSLLQFQGFGSLKVGESSNPAPAPPRKAQDEPAEERTMFMTFSRGYPISEDELRNYFMKSYGDVIEEVQMEETTPNVQPLWARVVFSSTSIVAKILNGRKKIKFVIKGKHVWTRRFVSRD